MKGFRKEGKRRETKRTASKETGKGWRDKDRGKERETVLPRTASSVTNPNPPLNSPLIE